MVRLVTGGTGFIGRHLLRELAKREGDRGFRNASHVTIAGPAIRI